MQNQSFEVLIPLHVEMRVAIQVRAVRVKCLVQICSMNCFIMFCQIILSKSFKQVPPPSSTWLWLKKWWHGPISYHPLRELIPQNDHHRQSTYLFVRPRLYGSIFLQHVGSAKPALGRATAHGRQLEASQPAQEESNKAMGFLRAPRMEQEMYGCSLKNAILRTYIFIYLHIYIIIYMCVCPRVNTYIHTYIHTYNHITIYIHAISCMHMGR